MRTITDLIAGYHMSVLPFHVFGSLRARQREAWKFIRRLAILPQKSRFTNLFHATSRNL